LEEGNVDFELPPNVEEFRQELREFLAREWPPERRSRVAAGDTYEEEREFRRKLAQKGWLAMSWPKEYGGQGRSILEQYIFSEEMAYHGAPAGTVGVGQVGPTLMSYGSDEQKQRFLPRIAAGEMDFALGYTEPEAGTDLASLQTRAVADGDDFVINGTKIYTSAAHRAEYVWLATRTDPDAPKHRGISLFIVDLKSPGITIRPLWTMGDGRTNQTFYDNVRVPRENLVGELNRGWYYVAHALDFERITVFTVATLRAGFDDLVAWVRQASYDGYPLREDPEVRDQIARLSADLEVAQLLSYRVAWMISKGQHPNYEASMLKVFSTEFMQRLYQEGTRILGLYGQLTPASPLAPAGGRFERSHRSSVMPTFGAGSSEIQRNIIATRGLGLPRA
jgi:alkylation response protein AidB-like acyl-CoA dehydrogenase